MVAYLVSLWFVEQLFAGAAAPDHEQAWPQPQVVYTLRALIQERIAADGVVRLSTATGAFVAR